MFSRRNKKSDNRQKNNDIRGESLTDESLDLNTSIGNQAMIENLDLISDYGDDLSLAMEQEAAWKSREVDLLTNRPRLKKKSMNLTKIPI